MPGDRHVLMMELWPQAVVQYYLLAYIDNRAIISSHVGASTEAAKAAGAE